MDYETSASTNGKTRGSLMASNLPDKILHHPDKNFLTPAVVPRSGRDTVDVPHIISWADTERDRPPEWARRSPTPSTRFIAWKAGHRPAT
jgi:hypothetical protein